MASSADDLVSYYKRTLAGMFFTKPATLVEFKRLLSNNVFFPPDVAGYGKGGSDNLLSDRQDVADSHTISFAGQMVVRATPVTFAFVVNWTDANDQDASNTLAPAFIETVRMCLAAIKRSLDKA